jgi:hypothetical protein
MPPITKAGNSAFRKDVEFVAKDDDEQVAAGIVMVPDKADLQHDFVRPDTIRSFADQFETFVEAGQAGGGIMHAVWPDDWMTLERNEVLDEAEEIGGQEVAAGAWVQEWAINHDDMWELILDGIISGYSIGAIQVDWNGPFDPDDDEVDDVTIPDGLPDDVMIWELIDGIIREVSAVDIPAVPDAEILEAKTLDKRVADHIGNQDAFVDEMMERGHTEAEAERVWDVLNEAIEVDGSGEPGKQSLLTRAAKAFISTLSGEDARPEPGRDDSKSSETPIESADQASKEGRTLSTANRDSLFATIDAAADVLEDAGVDHGIERFTDRDDVDFDLSDHDARVWAGNHDDEDEDDDLPFEVQDSKDASGGDNPDDNDTDMGDNPDNGGGDDKSLAEQNAEQINELTQAVEQLTETISGPQPKTAEIEIGGETYELPEQQVKAALGVDEDAGVGVAEAIESLKSEVEQQQRRLDTISQQSGVSTQLASKGQEESDDEGGLDDLGKALS